MTKEAYIGELRSYLGRLPLEEREAALVYYIEYFEDRGDDEAASQELGTPKEAAAKIIADYDERLRQSGQFSGSSGSTAKGCLIGLGAALAFPIWFPLLIAILAVVFSLGLVFIVLLFALGVVGVTLLPLTFHVMFISVPTGIAALGGALFCFGLLLLCLFPVFWLFSQGIPSLWRMISKKKKEEM